MDERPGVLWRIGVFLGVLAILGAAALWAIVHQSRKELAATRARLEARGETLDYRKLVPPAPPKENNGLKEFRLAAAELKDLVTKNKMSPLGFGRVETKPGRAEAAFQRATVKQGKDELSWDAVRRQQELVAPVLERIRRAARAVVFAEQLDYSRGFAMDLGSATPALQAAQYLARENLILLRDGRVDEAAVNVTIMFRLAELNRREPLLITQLVNASILGIASVATWEILAADPSVVTVDRLQRAWLRTSVTEKLADTFRMERAIGVMTCDSLTPEMLNGIMSRPAPTRMDRVSSSVVLTLWSVLVRPSDERLYLESLQRVIDHLSPTPDLPIAIDEGERVDEEIQKAGVALLLCKLALPSTTSSVSRFALTETLRELTITALALRNYQLVHDGDLPTTLSELVPAYLPALPRDPFSGQALRYHVMGSQFLLYGVGENRIDDAGNPNLPAGKSGRAMERGLDIVWPQKDPSPPAATP